MLGGVLDLRDLQVADIMVHRTKMETINADDTPQTVLDELLRSQYTRVPIWKDDPENIVGVLHTKDLFSALGRSGWDVSKLDIMSFAVEPWFVPDTTPLKDQLNQFLKRKAQMALVVDEYGEVQGLITLEDILEEIVGQIADEHDTQEAAIRVQADGTVNVDGTVAVRDLNRQMNWNMPDEEATTIAGLVIHEAQTIPEPGQVFTFYGYRFEILRKTRNKITALRISPASAVAARAARAGERRTVDVDHRRKIVVQVRFRRRARTCAWIWSGGSSVRALLNRIEMLAAARSEIEKGATMTRFLPLAAIAGALACVVAVGSAQAAPASGNILGKLTTVSEARARLSRRPATAIIAGGITAGGRSVTTSAIITVTITAATGTKRQSDT